MEHPKYNGFYIEAGAGDGEIISNSLYFEINYKVICKTIWEMRFDIKKDQNMFLQMKLEFLHF